MEGIRCFLLTRTGTIRRWLRRYQKSEDRSCPAGSYHDARVLLDEVPAVSDDDTISTVLSWPKDDPRWPKACSACGYVFPETDEWQLFTQRLYIREGGERTTIQEAPAGAMWDAHWLEGKGPDGMSLVVKLPNDGTWAVDERAADCTKPEDTGHRCWLRHGIPPDITVDKLGGPTCGAVSGPAGSKGWVGKLINGVLMPYTAEVGDGLG